jgi:hypothetical protein
MKRILIALSLALPLPALAQGTPAAPAAAEAGAADTKDVNAGTPVKDPVDLAREDIRNQRADLLAKNMHLSAAQAAKFWPIYKKFEADRQKIGDQRVAAVTDYLAHVDTLTDKQASTMLKGVFDREDKYLKLRKSYAPQFAKAIPGTMVLRFYMIDGFLDTIINLQLLAQLPLVK